MTVTIDTPAELLIGRVVERDLDVATIDPRTRHGWPRAGSEQDTSGVWCQVESGDPTQCSVQDTVSGDCAASAGGGMIACFIDTSDQYCGGGGGAPVETLDCGHETTSGCPVETLDCGHETVSGCGVETIAGCGAEPQETADCEY